MSNPYHNYSANNAQEFSAGSWQDYEQSNIASSYGTANYFDNVYHSSSNEHYNTAAYEQQYLTNYAEPHEKKSLFRIYLLGIGIVAIVLVFGILAVTRTPLKEHIITQREIITITSNYSITSTAVHRPTVKAKVTRRKIHAEEAPRNTPINPTTTTAVIPPSVAQNVPSEKLLSFMNSDFPCNRYNGTDFTSVGLPELPLGSNVVKTSLITCKYMIGNGATSGTLIIARSFQESIMSDKNYLHALQGFSAQITDTSINGHPAFIATITDTARGMSAMSNITVSPFPGALEVMSMIFVYPNGSHSFNRAQALLNFAYKYIA